MSNYVKSDEQLIPVHGGYRQLKSFQVARLVYDITLRFCDRYIGKRSRTHDQMVQAARSGVQNIAEGSVASGTSKKTELRLTNVARASLEELRLDYEDYLRQRGLSQWPPSHPALARFKVRRCATLDQMKAWVDDERRRARTDTDKQGLKGSRWTDTDEHGRTRSHNDVSVRESPCQSTDKQGPARRPNNMSVRESPCASVPSSAELVANGALSLLNLCCYLLDRQLATLEKKFVAEGGFTERLYRVRSRYRK
jgi:four helix bundle suffix protein